MKIGDGLPQQPPHHRRGNLCGAGEHVGSNWRRSESERPAQGFIFCQGRKAGCVNVNAGLGCRYHRCGSDPDRRCCATVAKAMRVSSTTAAAKSDKLDGVSAACSNKPDPTKRERAEQLHHIPLHRQVIPWAMRSNVTAVHRADNWLEWRWVTVGAKP
jgi:hypothetical protein